MFSPPPPRIDSYNDAVQIIRQCDAYFKALNIEPTFGTEVEFYLIKPYDDQNRYDVFLEELKSYLEGTETGYYDVLEECGHIVNKTSTGQKLEVATTMVTSGRDALRVTQQTQLAIVKLAEQCNANVSFEAFPKDASQAAGFHIHFGLREANSKRNLLLTQDNQSNVLATYLRDSVLQALSTDVLATALHSKNQIWRIKNGSFSPKIETECVRSIIEGGGASNFHYEYRLPAATKNTAIPLAGLMLMMVDGMEDVVRQSGYDCAIDNPNYDPQRARAAIETQWDVPGALQIAYEGSKIIHLAKKISALNPEVLANFLSEQVIR